MSHEVNCKHCGRYLFTASGTVIVEQLPCPNSKCRAKLNIKIVSNDATHDDLRYRFKTEEQPPKSTTS